MPTQAHRGGRSRTEARRISTSARRPGLVKLVEPATVDDPALISARLAWGNGNGGLTRRCCRSRRGSTSRCRYRRGSPPPGERGFGAGIRRR